LTYAINRIKDEAISRLDIDLRNEGEHAAAPHHKEIYKIAQGIGNLDLYPQLIEGLLGL
jgi:hypothetical protein